MRRLCSQRVRRILLAFWNRGSDWVPIGVFASQGRPGGSHDQAPLTAVRDLGRTGMTLSLPITEMSMSLTFYLCPAPGTNQTQPTNVPISSVELLNS